MTAIFKFFKRGRLDRLKGINGTLCDEKGQNCGFMVTKGARTRLSTTISMYCTGQIRGKVKFLIEIK
jgi:hypothetical protein